MFLMPGTRSDVNSLSPRDRRYIEKSPSHSLLRTQSTGSMRRSPSSPTLSSYITHRFYAGWISLIMCISFAFWNIRTGEILINRENPLMKNIPNSVTKPLHPQDRYIRAEKMTNSRLSQYRGPNGPKYNVLVTGAAGFVGMFTALELKKLGMTPVGYDNINPYYSTDLKRLRIDELQRHNIEFIEGDVCDSDKLKQTLQDHNITRVIHLAAQAGVRYSLDHPYAYTRNNVDCFVHLLETMVDLGLTKDPLVFASSSSVYGNNAKIPFRESDRLEDPASLYATTKRTDELIAQTYFNLHKINSIGLRFFTVYGPFGRPDMAPWLFTDKISNNDTIRVFNNGHSRRDFTYVEDIVQGVVNSLFVNTGQPELINLGYGRPILLSDFVQMVEGQLGRKANIDYVPMQKGDVPVTYADISKARRLLGYNPNTPIEEGIKKFVHWFKKNDASKYRMKDGKKATSTIKK